MGPVRFFAIEVLSYSYTIIFQGALSFLNAMKKIPGTTSEDLLFPFPSIQHCLQPIRFTLFSNSTNALPNFDNYVPYGSPQAYYFKYSLLTGP
ncbi:hypothetical protein L218DRAFT_668154 [Marasmius fiardii PR-910]|nr:hypothetical protein L218DRAFT_668154 [Marasmius fiardii PR-910]